MGRHGEEAGLWRFADLQSLAGGDEDEIEGTVILGAYHPRYRQLSTRKKPLFWWTSRPFEMEQTGDVEMSELRNIVKRYEMGQVGEVLFGVASPDARSDLADALGVGVPVSYPVGVELGNRQRSVVIPGSIGLFCPAKPSKNVYTQLVAVRLAQKKRGGVLYTNLTTLRPVLDWLGVNYEAVGWMPGDDYYDLLSRIEVNLAVSWSESFNYQAVEAALLGVPTVGSEAGVLSEVTTYYHDLDADDAHSIAECVEITARHSIHLGEEARSAVLGLAARNNHALAEVLGQVALR